MNSGSARENQYIRIPRRARKRFETQTDKISISYGKKTVGLEIKPAFKEDIVELKQSIEEGKLTKEESTCVGFVTAATLQGLMGRSKKAATDYCYLSDDIEDIMLGADPEFVLVDPRTRAYKYAGHISGFYSQGVLGADGPLAEVRPPPASYTEGVVDNIKAILRKGHPSIKGYNWFAGATYGNPRKKGERILHIGGHIHLGDPLIIPNAEKQGIYKQIIRMLDELMAIPLVRVDGPFAHLRRNTRHSNGYGCYGLWGDTRPQPGRFEWRVPSGLWLSHPDFARAVLGTSKAITETCYQMMAEKRFDPKWVLARADGKGFLKQWKAIGAQRAAKIVNAADPKSVTHDMIKSAHEKMRGMDNYTKYKDEIDEFIRLTRLSEKDKRCINLDIRDTWLNGGNLVKEIR
jgi:hypothetical protein